MYPELPTRTFRASGKTSFCCGRLQIAPASSSARKVFDDPSGAASGFFVPASSQAQSSLDLATKQVLPDALKPVQRGRRSFRVTLRRPAAFTLIEVMTVAVIMAIIAMAIHTAFGNGIRLWRLAGREVVQKDVVLFFTRMSADVRNLMKYPEIDFQGKEKSISFATLVPSDIAGKGGRSIGRVTYYFNEIERYVGVRKMDFSQEYLGKGGDTRRPLRNVREMTIEYYCYDSENEKYLWLEAWNKKKAPIGLNLEELLPLAVKVKLVINDEGREKSFLRIMGIRIDG